MKWLATTKVVQGMGLRTRDERVSRVGGLV